MRHRLALLAAPWLCSLAASAAEPPGFYLAAEPPGFYLAAEPPGFYLAAEQQPLPGETAEVLVRSRGEEAGAAHASIFRVGAPSALLAHIPDLSRVLAPEGGPLAAAIARARAGSPSEMKLGLVEARDLAVSADFAQPAKLRFRPASPGLYLVAVELNEQVAYALVNVTSLALVWKRGTADALAFAADPASAPRRSRWPTRYRAITRCAPSITATTGTP